MIDPRFPTATTLPFTGEPAPPPTEQVLGLQQRIQRLEDAVAALQDTRALEERLVERVAERVQTPPPPTEGEATPGLLASAGRRLLPMLSLVRRDDDLDPPPAAIPVTAPARTPWLVFEVYDEFRTILRMILDPRYRMTWAGRLVPLAALMVMFLSYFLLAGRLWVLGDVVDKAVDIVLSLVIFKALGREANRYRAATVAPPAVPVP